MHAHTVNRRLPVFPPEIHRYVRAVFRGANRRVCEKIARVPNCSEPSLDMTLIEHLTHYCGPTVVAPGWAVRLDVHFLGGLRHFRSWEIADIGILVSYCLRFEAERSIGLDQTRGAQYGGARCHRVSFDMTARSLQPGRGA